MRGSFFRTGALSSTSARSWRISDLSCSVRFCSYRESCSGACSSCCAVVFPNLRMPFLVSPCKWKYLVMLPICHSADRRKPPMIQPPVHKRIIEVCPFTTRLDTDRYRRLHGERQGSDELLVYAYVGGIADAEGLFQLAQAGAPAQQPYGEGGGGSGETRHIPTWSQRFQMAFCNDFEVVTGRAARATMSSASGPHAC